MLRMPTTDSYKFPKFAIKISKSINRTYNLRFILQNFHNDTILIFSRVMPYSTGCATPLSNFEVAQNYKDVVDPAVMVTFPLDDQPEVSLIAWTTTPWTLPSNLALCVHPDMDYVQIKVC